MADAPIAGLHPDADVRLDVDPDGAGVELLSGVAFGAAGALIVDLEDGSQWWVDATDPDQFVALDPADPWPGSAALATDPVLIALFGGDVALALSDGTGGGERRRDVPGRRRTLPSPVAALHLQLDLAGDADQPPLARIAAGCDVLVELDDGRIPGSRLFAGRRNQVSRQVATTARSLDEADVAGLDPRFVGHLARSVELASKLQPSLGNSLRALRDWLQRYGVDEVPAVAAFPISPAGERFAAAAPSAQPDTAPVGAGTPVPHADSRSVSRCAVDEPPLVSERTTSTLLTLRCDDQDRVGQWVVVRRADGLVHIGHAPLLHEDGRLVARVAVPPDLADDGVHLWIEAAEDPLAPAIGSAPLPNVLAAVRSGRAACRLERLGRWPEAQHLWLVCSDLWEQLGDRQRSQLARDHADWGSTAGRLQPSLADVIAAE